LKHQNFDPQGQDSLLFLTAQYISKVIRRFDMEAQQKLGDAWDNQQFYKEE